LKRFERVKLKFLLPHEGIIEASAYKFLACANFSKVPAKLFLKFSPEAEVNNKSEYAP
jgi:hypothetical protein